VTAAEKQAAAQAVGLTLGQFIHYKLMRRWGAPKWAAWSSAIITTHLVKINNTLKEV
jgi:hypothetical protein